MLMQIYINHLITIQELQLDLKSGTTVITGETGAGKSILMDAIALALGERATSEVVRPGQEKADISLYFDIQHRPEVMAWLKNHDLEQETNECIIRRTINKDSRSRSYINGTPITLQLLRELSEMLIHIHGQHEHHALLKPDTQRNMLDRFAGHHHLISQTQALAEKWHVLIQELNTLKKLSHEHSQRSDFLAFQIQELQKLHLTPHEFIQLDAEHKQLAHSGELLQNINHSLNCLSENEETNTLKSLHHAIQTLESIQRIDPKITNWIESLNHALIHIQDTETDLRRYIESIDLDPERLQQTEHRISTLFEIARKHRIAPQDLYEFQQTLLKEYSALQNSDERINELQEAIRFIEKNYHEVAHQLSLSRQKAAKKLAQHITETIHTLSLPHAEFQVQLESSSSASLSSYGLEKIIFQIKINAGQSFQPLAKIVSGGELSRVSLAIHIATTEEHTIPTLIFDEVDVGIGGGTAEVVGKLLRRLGGSHQVFCITHAPQVAAQGHQHLHVEKFTQNNITSTHIRQLTQAEKINEIARMLGGIEITKKTLSHAKEMIEKTQIPV